MPEYTPRDDFIKQGADTLEYMLEAVRNAPRVSLEEFSSGDTLVVSMDMVNGFCREGTLYSPRIKAMLPDTARLFAAVCSAGYPLVAFADTHTSGSTELKDYGPHCLQNTDESELADELKEIGGYTLIPKNCTNGFFAPQFTQYWSRCGHIHHVIVTGDCTDICVLQFALSLKAHSNQYDRSLRIVVPVNLVDTYDYGENGHNADIMNLFACYNMSLNGIEIVYLNNGISGGENAIL